MTQADLAKMMGVTPAAISQCLKKPSYDTLSRIASSLDVDLSELFAPREEEFLAMVKDGDQMRCFFNKKDLREFLK